MGILANRKTALSLSTVLASSLLLVWFFSSTKKVTIQYLKEERAITIQDNDLEEPTQYLKEETASTIQDNDLEETTQYVKEETAGTIQDNYLAGPTGNGTQQHSEQSYPQANPGCKAKTLHAYKAVYTSKQYKYPSLVHYAKLGSGMQRFNFREYTSVLSVYKFLKPEKIMFHTYTGFTGAYWDKIQELKNVKIEVKKINRISTIGGQHVVWIQHVADYVKLSSVYKYGGTALDFDVVIINGTRLKHEQSLSECVLAEETDFINGGFYSCIPNSTFIANWLDSYHKDYKPHLWLYNISFPPLHLLTDKDNKECYNVHLDDTICLFPSWSVNKEWLVPGKVEWRTKTAAHYFVKNGIPNDGEGLLKENFPLAQLIQYVHNA